MNILTRPWRLAFDYKRRSTRREFLLFVVAYYAVLFLGALALGSVEPVNPGVAAAGGIPLALWMFGSFIPFISLVVRRLHDHNKTGWFVLVSLFPIFGWIYFAVMMFTPGDEDDNSYGPNPRYGEQAPNPSQVFA